SRWVIVPRDQTCPQAASVMRSWNGASNAVLFASARSTWAAPSTLRRVARPCSKRSDLPSLSVIAVLFRCRVPIGSVWQPDIVFRERGRGRARAYQIVELRLLDLLPERALVGK